MVVLWCWVVLTFCDFGLWFGMFHCISIVLCVWLFCWCALIVGILFCFSLCFAVYFWFAIGLLFAFVCGCLAYGLLFVNSVVYLLF